jgi:hypothetical protein
LRRAGGEVGRVLRGDEPRRDSGNCFVAMAGDSDGELGEPRQP